MIRIYFFGFWQDNSQPGRPLYDNFLTQLRAWVHYAVTLVFPLNLNVDYDFPVSHSLLEGGVIVSIFILAMLGWIIWKVARVCRPAGFFALWFAINLLPTNSLIPLKDVITDRWLYLPSVGYAVIMALGAEWIFRAKVRGGNRARKIIFFFLCALIVELYGFATVVRNFTWTSYWTLWEDAAAKSPNKSRPHLALALGLNQAGRTAEAIEELKKAAQLDPKGGEAYLNLGYIYFHQRKLDEAIQAFQKAIVLTPRLAADGHNNLGAVYLLQGRNEEAIQELQLALKERPHYSRPYSSLGNYYEKEGDIDKAISYMEQAAKLEPEFVPAHESLVRLYEKKGWKEKSQEARKNFLKYDALGRRAFFGG
jgi:Tfp pilus assembly protein PilF